MGACLLLVSPFGHLAGSCLQVSPGHPDVDVWLSGRFTERGEPLAFTPLWRHLTCSVCSELRSHGDQQTVCATQLYQASRSLTASLHVSKVTRPCWERGLHGEEGIWPPATLCSHPHLLQYPNRPEPFPLPIPGFSLFSPLLVEARVTV